MFKPELLLPAGSLETFFAAIEGGSDAIYLGLKKFNARNRAKNFSFYELQNIVTEANTRNIKVYVTLNTLIKNSETTELIETLAILNQIKPNALIIQDLALANIVNSYFPKLQIHASTQMAVHNSASCNFLKDNGFSRVVLARELTLNELSVLSQNVEVETEFFIHGALCYSVSGQCLFSSYLGGNSANRGLCTQVCRRNFKNQTTRSPLFSMKDFQLIDYIPLFSKMRISSLKVEGRMKTADYVYNVARAYRLAIDDHSKIDEAKNILQTDFAREKTSWFIGKDVKNATTSKSETGCFVGQVDYLNEGYFSVKTEIQLTKNAKLRIRNSKDTEAEYIKIARIIKEQDSYKIYTDTQNMYVGQELYLVGFNDFNLKTKFTKVSHKSIIPCSRQKCESIKRSFQVVGSKNTVLRLFVRVGSLANLKKLDSSNFEAVFLKASLCEFESLLSFQIGNSAKEKVFIELPKYISELALPQWCSLLQRAAKIGYNRFAISNISQLALLPEKCFVAANENLYLLNDIAVNFAKQYLRYYCYSCENDYPNLISGRDRGGIIPVFFRPQLFYSRQPIQSAKFLDDSGLSYKKHTESGFTIITDNRAVSWTQNIEKFRAKGFTRFLIDVSNDSDFENLTSILQSVNKSVKMANTTDFNMKKGLK